MMRGAMFADVGKPNVARDASNRHFGISIIDHVNVWRGMVIHKQDHAKFAAFE
jgi:hypothetical protein